VHFAREPVTVLAWVVEGLSFPRLRGSGAWLRKLAHWFETFPTYLLHD
jgi:hypothetical protein